MKDTKIKLGISTCLLGERVRYDGEKRLDYYLKFTIGRYFDWVPVCPEVECGMSVPREPMRLEGDPSEPGLIATIYSKIDKTSLIKRWLKVKLEELRTEDLSGFVFKSRSPSCGLRVDIFDEKGNAIKKVAGMFASSIMKVFPHMPVADDEDLWQPEERENFIERVLSYRHWQEFSKKRKSRRNILEFHTEHKLQIMAHSRRHLQELGRLVAEAKALSTDELYNRYLQLFMDALKLRATRKKHTKVLQHIMGCFKRHLSSDEKKELIQTIEDYSLDRIPLVVPVAILSHYASKFDVEYLKRQFYLSVFKRSLS